MPHFGHCPTPARSACLMSAGAGSILPSAAAMTGVSMVPSTSRSKTIRRSLKKGWRWFAALLRGSADSRFATAAPAELAPTTIYEVDIFEPKLGGLSATQIPDCLGDAAGDH